MNEQRRLGTHLLEIREDTQILRLNGPYTEDDLRAMLPIGDAIMARYGYYISITDSSHAAGMTPGARRLNAEWVRERPQALGISIVFGASLPSRVLLTLITRASALMSKRSPRIELVDSEQAAFALADVERPRLAAEARRRGHTG